MAIIAAACIYVTLGDAKNSEDIAVIKGSITTIETNHLTHLQAAMDDLNERDKEQDALMREMDKKLDRLLLRAQ